MLSNKQDQVQNTFNSQSSNYSCQSNISKTIKIERSIVGKIFYSINKNKKLTNQLIHKISAYLFGHPIVLSYPLYEKIKNSQIGIGSFLLYNQKNHNSMRIQIVKYWRKLKQQQTTMQNIMLYSKQFGQFMNFRINIDSQFKEYRQQKLISENNNYYIDLFKIINKYNENRVINEFVFKAYKQLMQKNILIISTQHNQQYMYIERQKNIFDHHNKKVTNINLKNKNGKAQFSFGISFQSQNLRIVCNEHSIYTLIIESKPRGRQTLRSNLNLQQIIENIYVY